MCNDYRLEVEIASIMEDFDDLKIRIGTPEGTPNVPSRADIKMTDIAPIVRSVEGTRGAGELVNRRWSWPGQNKKPVYNFRSEGREFTSGRCLILADGFYECRHLALASRGWRGVHDADHGTGRRCCAVPFAPDRPADP
jgi:putative SOS response-associated peptidase YedK